MRRLRQQVIEAKENAVKNSGSKKKSADAKRMNNEIGQWLTLWLQSPELFENWLKLRRGTADFKDAFGEIE